MNKLSHARGAPIPTRSAVWSYWIDIVLGCLALAGAIALLAGLKP